MMFLVVPKLVLARCSPGHHSHGYLSCESAKFMETEPSERSTGLAPNTLPCCPCSSAVSLWVGQFRSSVVSGPFLGTISTFNDNTFSSYLPPCLFKNKRCNSQEQREQGADT